ncbi:MAG TPA: ATP-binding protein, partial [Dehalococcoidia bacterium]|nr:ATP-binding protein [Dehalococcoidia bacterium]
PAFADVCCVDLLRDDGTVERVSISLADPAWSEAARGLSAFPPGTNPENPIEQVLAGSSGVLRAELTDADLLAFARSPEHLAALRAIGQRSLIVAPLRARGRVLGALTMMYGWSGRRYTEADLLAVQDLAGRAALAVDNASLFHAAEDERRRLRQVLAVLPEGIATLDTANRMAAENATAAEILGLFPDGTPEFVPPDRTLSARRMDGTSIPQADLPPWRALRGEIVRGEQIIIIHPREGHDVPLLVNSAPLRDGRGALVGSVSAFQDISAIHEFERARDEFLASASHDLRTPLTAIQGFTQLLLRRARRGKRDEALLDPLEGIERAAGRMAGLVRELLDVARLQMGQPLELDRRPVDLVQLARQEAAIRNEMNRLHDVRVRSEEPAIVGRWDGARLERVLANLVGNAVKFSPAGGEVVIGLAREASVTGREQAVLTVHDRGVGIAAADLPHVFNRFYRGRHGRRVEGMGLGLATVRQIVEQHGGSVDAASSPGEGTTFTVRLPLDGG